MTQFIFALVLALCPVWGTNALGADTVYPEHPKDVRITGSLLPFTEAAREDIIMVHVFLGDEPRLLRIGSIENLSADEKERAVDEGILMRQVRFYGEDEVMQRLQQSATLGKVLTIEGRLDVQQRRFLVKSVTEKSEKKTETP